MYWLMLLGLFKNVAALVLDSSKMHYFGGSNTYLSTFWSNTALRSTFEQEIEGEVMCFGLGE